MAKKVGVALMGAFVALVVGFNLYSYYTTRNSGSSMSGMAVGNLSTSVNISLIAFVMQWVILLLIVMFAYMRFLKHRKEEEQKIANFIIPKPRTIAETHIDIFYNLLKEKESLTTGTIAKAFKISKEQALDWAKVLEEHGLASIEYPAFADPEIKVENFNKTLPQKQTQKQPEKKEEDKNKKETVNQKDKKEKNLKDNEWIEKIERARAQSNSAKKENKDTKKIKE